MDKGSVKDSVKKAMLCMTRQCWEQGIVAQALLETEDVETLELVVYDVVLRRSEDGRLCNVENTPAITDSSFSINATMAIGKEKKDSRYLKAAKQNILFLLNHTERSEDGVLYHMKGAKEIWADSAAFTPYALSLGGYHKEAIEQMKGLQRKLYDPVYKLYYHIWDEETKEYKRNIFWGIGNGWFLTGLIRLYQVLPHSYEKEKRELNHAFIELLDAMLAWETKNHLFYDDMINKNSFEETESSEMIAYAIYRGVKEKILDKEYLERANQIRKAVHKKVGKNGLVMDCASSPDFVLPGTSVEGQAHFLMMEHAFYKCGEFNQQGLM